MVVKWGIFGQKVKTACCALYAPLSQKNDELSSVFRKGSWEGPQARGERERVEIHKGCGCWCPTNSSIETLDSLAG